MQDRISKRNQPILNILQKIRKHYCWNYSFRNRSLFKIDKLRYEVIGKIWNKSYSDSRHDLTRCSAWLSEGRMSNGMVPYRKKYASDWDIFFVQVTRYFLLKILPVLYLKRENSTFTLNPFCNKMPASFLKIKRQVSIWSHLIIFSHWSIFLDVIKSNQSTSSKTAVWTQWPDSIRFKIQIFLKIFSFKHIFHSKEWKNCTKDWKYFPTTNIIFLMTVQILM